MVYKTRATHMKIDTCTCNDVLPFLVVQNVI